MMLGEIMYKKGDIVLISFPFTDLSSAKTRPVLIIKDENNRGDFVCFQITSNINQTSIKEIKIDDVYEELRLKSFVKYDKCFTLNSLNIKTKISSCKVEFLKDLKSLFCQEIF
jgi:mRNA interferase MazF